MMRLSSYFNPDLAHGANFVWEPWFRHTTSETIRQSYAIYIRYQIWNIASAQQWYFTAQMLW